MPQIDNVNNTAISAVIDTTVLPNVDIATNNLHTFADNPKMQQPTETFEPHTNNEFVSDEFDTMDKGEFHAANFPPEMELSLFDFDIGISEQSQISDFTTSLQSDQGLNQQNSTGTPDLDCSFNFEDTTLSKVKISYLITVRPPAKIDFVAFLLVSIN